VKPTCGQCAGYRESKRHPGTGGCRYAWGESKAGDPLNWVAADNPVDDLMTPCGGDHFRPRRRKGTAMTKALFAQQQGEKT
jgi:hypothetical protein